MATTEKESVEALAERIAVYANGRAELKVPAYADTIESFLTDWIHAHGIAAIAKQLPMDDGEKQAPPAEPVVSEDSPAQGLLNALWDKHHINTYGDLAGCYDIIKQHIDDAIAKHNAADREELALANRRGEELCGLIAEKKTEITDLQAQLAEATKRVENMEQQCRFARNELTVARNSVQTVWNWLGVALPQPATPHEGK